MVSAEIFNVISVLLLQISLRLHPRIQSHHLDRLNRLLCLLRHRRRSFGLGWRRHTDCLAERIRLFKLGPNRLLRGSSRCLGSLDLVVGPRDPTTTSDWLDLTRSTSTEERLLLGIFTALRVAILVETCRTAILRIVLLLRLVLQEIPLTLGQGVDALEGGLCWRISNALLAIINFGASDPSVWCLQQRRFLQAAPDPTADSTAPTAYAASNAAADTASDSASDTASNTRIGSLLDHGGLRTTKRLRAS